MNRDGHVMEDYTSVEERRLRRYRLRGRRRARELLLLSTLVATITIIILFCPMGPFGHLIFPGSPPSDQNDPARTAGDGGHGATVHAEQEIVPELTSKNPRVEKASNPTAPTVAIVVDDTAQSDKHLSEWLAIDAPLTFSALPYCEAASEVANRLYAAGFRIMLHIPTENDPPNSFSGTGQLATGMDRVTVFATLDGDLAQVPYATGINNHQGGRGCNDLTLMTYQCEWAAEHGLFAMDSDSSTDSQVTKAMASLGMPRRENQVFVDHDNSPQSICSAMRQLADIARSDGVSIGICHFARPNTARTVGEMIRTLQAEGIHFAFVQDVGN